MFRALSRDARAWLKKPDDARLTALAARAREAIDAVPRARRGDWERLVAGLAKDEPAPKRRARVEGLVRACALFDRPALAWEDPVDALPGLGPSSRAALAKSGVARVADLVWTLPIAWDDARAPASVRDAIARSTDVERPPRLCVVGVVKSAAVVPMRGRRAVRVVVADEADPKATLHAWWFFLAQAALSVAKVGARVLLVGRLLVDGRKPPRAAHPEIAVDAPAARVVRPRYPRLGATEAALRSGIAAALARLDALPDPVPAAIAAREQMPDVAPLLRALHGDDGALAAPPDEATRRAALDRLAWAEAFTRVWGRLSLEAQPGGGGAPPLPIDRAALARLRAELGFPLTAGQERAVETIARELSRRAPMRRLLLGDVGTGKTAVALAAAAQCVRAGRQVAILAPTSVLAEQYMDAVAPLARATGASIALFAAGMPAAARRKAEAGLARGAIDVAVGTHALLREGVAFAKLGLVIVDEQHRLGVAQRLALVQKGRQGGEENAAPRAPSADGDSDGGSDGDSPSPARGETRPHLLTLSATPIPRTLALALRGELATSHLDERPKGRPPVATEMRPRASFPEVVEEVRAACARGERAFVVAPRIDVDPDDDEDDDRDGGSGAVRLAEALGAALAPIRVTLVHGALSADAKRQAMRAFRSGEAQVLVGTTVVEVGVDVPEATLMVIDGAERFGLAQLHQLRGRVGRGDRPGRCVLLHPEPLDGAARARLEALCRLSSGVEIAKADLALRGAGDLGGTRQSGMEEELLYLDPAAPPAWLARIEADARALRRDDPSLAQPEHRALALFVRRLEVAIRAREEAG